MIKFKTFFVAKIVIAVMATIVCGVLLGTHPQSIPYHPMLTIGIALDHEMLVQDIPTAKGDMVTRLQASQSYIHCLVAQYPQYAFGLVTQTTHPRYLLPPTQDTGTFLQYIDSLLVNTGETTTTSEWSSGLQASLLATPMLRFGSAPPTFTHMITTISPNALRQHTCTDIHIPGMTKQDHGWSAGQRQGLLGWLIVMIFLLLL